MKRGVKLIPIVGLLLIVLIGALFLASSFTGNAVILAGTYSCLSNSIGAQVYNPSYQLYYQNNNKCKDTKTLTKYVCTSATASNWFSALFMTSSSSQACAAGCANNACLPTCTDADKDGYGAGCSLGLDCNDNNANINPGNAEVCDSLDNNCNNQIDEGVLNTCMNYQTCTTFTSCAACAAAPTEVCTNGRDDNCNNQIDEGCTVSPPPPTGSIPQVPSRTPIAFGVEYVSQSESAPIGLIGLDSVKLSPLAYTRWDRIQSCNPNNASGQLQSLSSVNFAALDNIIKTYQNGGVKNIVIALDPTSVCASVDGASVFPTNILPKVQYVDAYQTFVSALVERYDKDGVNDASGLLYPVKYYEVGTEFSAYEPEPVSEYLPHLQRTYTTIHQAFPNAVVMPAAFLTTKAFELNPSSSQYATAFQRVPDQKHGLADIRAVLDHPESFDMLNVHSLGDPYELEGIAKWMTYESNQRGYSKPLFVSDGEVTPFVFYGNAMVCPGDVAYNYGHGVAVDPVQDTQADRCRVKEYFVKLNASDASTIAWTQGFAASDLVKRFVIAADQNVVGMNMAFTQDNPLFKNIAGGGNTGWAGFVEIASDNNCAFLFKCRASVWSLKQLKSRVGGYTAMGRVSTTDPNVRVYLFMKGTTPVWVAWYENPKQVVLPGDTVPSTSVDLFVGKASVNVESVITQGGASAPAAASSVVSATNNVATITLTNTPVYVY